MEDHLQKKRVILLEKMPEMSKSLQICAMLTDQKELNVDFGKLILIFKEVNDTLWMGKFITNIYVLLRHALATIFSLIV
jgi:hypothetical protein